MSGRSSGTPDPRSHRGGKIILLDGWPLVYYPGSPPALHLLELMQLLPAGVDARVALPAPLAEPLPVSPVLAPTRPTGRGRFIWEQMTLPRLMRQVNAAALHTTAFFAPLFSPGLVFTSPGESFHTAAGPARTPAGRLRNAFARGGLAARAGRVLLWPEDLPSPDLAGLKVHRLPPVVFPGMDRLPDFTPGGDSGYALAFGAFEGEAGLEKLVSAWGWAAPALGDDWALLLAGCPTSAAPRLQAAREAARLPGELLPAPLSVQTALFELLAGASAVLHAGPLAPWGDPLLHTLAAARPLAAEETWGVDPRVGPAAYLTVPDDGRALGAAILTLLVEGDIAMHLGQAARERAAGWRSQSFSEQLEEIYCEAMTA